MSESNIQKEIADLEVAIARKRSELEKQKGIVPDSRTLVREALSEHFGRESYSATASTDSTTVASITDQTSSSVTPKQAKKSYLDNLTAEQVLEVNALIDMVVEKGVKKAIEEAKKSSAFVLDAFHDALVDKMHDELKKRGII